MKFASLASVTSYAPAPGTDVQEIVGVSASVVHVAISVQRAGAVYSPLPSVNGPVIVNVHSSLDVTCASEPSNASMKNL